jgi:hypothetical protein
MNATRLLTLIVLMLALIACTLSEENRAVDDKEANIAETYATFSEEITEYWLSKPDEFGRADPDWMVKRFGSRFDRHIAANELEETSDNTLIYLYKATNTLVFFTQDKEKTRLLGRLGQELISRDLEGTLYVKQAHRQVLPQHIYNAFIDARLLSEADQWASKHSEHTKRIDARFAFGASPDDEDSPFVITIDTSDQTTVLRRQKVDLDDGRWIVGILHPNCGFSRQAMEALSATDTKRSLSKNWNTLWITGQKDLTPIDTLSDWNRNSKLFELSVPYETKAWPRFIDFSETPVFYFLKDGEVINEVRGWPTDEQKERFKRAIRSADAA